MPTPALLVDADALEHNLATMAAALPGRRLRPHVKAHKCSALARRQAALGHTGFTCATTREVAGLARAGLGEDLLLANEVLDPGRLDALARLVEAGTARVTVAVDSDATVDAAAAAGIAEVVVDVNVGLPRCGCDPGDAGRLADRARSAGLHVRGVMGYEGQVTIIADPAERAAAVEAAMDQLQKAHADTGGDVMSAGATVSYDINTWATEIQAGSYALMDTTFAPMAPAFREALTVLATVISVSPGWSVCDAGLKSLGMDHGNPVIDGASVFIVSDEHVTFIPDPDRPVRVGDRVRVRPAHVDPTVAYHEQMHVVDGDGTVVATWPVDLRGW
ncbi:MAG: putative amino acid aldolase or racemase [Acidimicrobiales bacterium]|jgi:D-serine deaminase-like pyridoxal phosphate-dependent protein|nr:putative amino acid aldolase or racemase [Acidimicrobiales bacterium]